MPNAVIEIKADEFGTTIKYSVPDFDNFGIRKREIEAEHSRKTIPGYEDIQHRSRWVNEDNPRILSVSLEPGIEWTDATKRRVDEITDQWNIIRPRVLEAVFDSYRNQYESVHAENVISEADELIIPRPVAASSIEDLFEFHTIHISQSSDAIGLQAECTWDDEHGIGVRIENGMVVEVGQAEVSFRFDSL